MTLDDSLMVCEYICRCEGRPYTAADFSVQKMATCRNEKTYVLLTKTSLEMVLVKKKVASGYKQQKFV